jgi:non-canonical (house-cleaning) NTP pyrophosphatase
LKIQKRKEDNMLVSIGSRSIPKITAITRAFSRYPELWINSSEKIEYIIMPQEVRKDESIGQEQDNFSGVSCNPMSLSETIEGAKNRAKNAFEYAKERTRHM